MKPIVYVRLYCLRQGCACYCCIVRKNVVHVLAILRENVVHVMAVSFVYVNNSGVLCTPIRISLNRFAVCFPKENRSRLILV